MKAKLFILWFAIALFLSAAIYGFTTTTSKSKSANAQASSKECPIVKDCPKKEDPDCPYQASKKTCGEKKDINASTASK